MQVGYRMTLRDWMSQIRVRLIGLMLLLVLLPVLVGWGWERWTLRGVLALGGPAYATAAGALSGSLNRGLLLQLAAALPVLLLGSWEARRLSRRATAVGLAADAFINRGYLHAELADQGRDELAWTASSYNQMMKRLQKIAAAAQQAATGDLTVQVKVRSDQDELAQSLNTMIANLRDLAGQIAQSATGMTAGSQHLNAVAVQAGQATNQIAATIQQVAEGIANQSGSTTQAFQLTDQLSHVIERVARGALEQAGAADQAVSATTQLSQVIQQVSESAQVQELSAAEAVDVSRNMAQQVQATVQAIEAIRARVEATALKIYEMGNRSGEIGAIVQVIEDIASQTNLLALNAAIEAARAGEHGLGFAVVADEVRKLAERSSKSTKEIAELIKGIRRVVDDSVQAMSLSAGEVEKGVVLVNETRGAIGKLTEVSEQGWRSGEAIAQAAGQANRLAEDAQEALRRVSEVANGNTRATAEMGAEADAVIRAVGNIASIGEENSAAAEQVSAATEEISAQAHEVTEAARTLAAQAELLLDLVGQFKLADQAAQAASAKAPRTGGNTRLPAPGNGKAARAPRQAVPALK